MFIYIFSGPIRKEHIQDSLISTLKIKRDINNGKKIIYQNYVNKIQFSRIKSRNGTWSYHRKILCLMRIESNYCMFLRKACKQKLRNWSSRASQHLVQQIILLCRTIHHSFVKPKKNILSFGGLLVKAVYLFIIRNSLRLSLIREGRDSTHTEDNENTVLHVLTIDRFKRCSACLNISKKSNSFFRYVPKCLRPGKRIFRIEQVASSATSWMWFPTQAAEVISNLPYL